MSAKAAALLVSAPSSGQGKTTVTAALARLHARQGRRVRVFKCGPDFLDPFWHQLASGQPAHNMDLWMTGEADARQRLRQAAQQADVVLVEGVMGLHDSDPSAADLARRFALPVLAVIQTGRMAQTLGAIAHGLRHWGEDTRGPLPWAGVLANGAASESHARLLRQALPDSEWLGHLPQSAAMHLPERHLGLIAAHEMPRAEALARLDAAADLLAATPLGQMSLAEWQARWPAAFDAPDAPDSGDAPESADAPDSPAPEDNAKPLAGRVIAIARDAAFAFIYPANVQTLHALGARTVFFSPLAGDALPACDALWLPGGYPELHAARLAARSDLKAQLHAHAAAGKPIWAECGGMMVLFERLTDASGHTWPLWGLLPGETAMQKRLGGLGMQQWAMPADSASGPLPHLPPLPPLRGHTFHYSAARTPLAPIAHTRPSPGSARTSGEAIYQHGSVRASYFHAWLPSSPPMAAWLFGA